jgi:hypothetical protein
MGQNSDKTDLDVSALEDVRLHGGRRLTSILLEQSIRPVRMALNQAIFSHEYRKQGLPMLSAISQPMLEFLRLARGELTYLSAQEALTTTDTLCFCAALKACNQFLTTRRMILQQYASLWYRVPGVGQC